MYVAVAYSPCLEDGDVVFDEVSVALILAHPVLEGLQCIVQRDPVSLATLDSVLLYERLILLELVTQIQ